MIVFVTAREDDLLKITGKEFEDYIKRAYEAGVADGMRELAAKPVQPILRAPDTTPIPCVGDTSDWWNNYRVYCGSTEIPVVYTARGE